MLPLDQTFRSYIHDKEGVVDRVIFSDRQIYEVELERIFARAWNFMCHESQIPNPGDFFLSFIGEESVIATRAKNGSLQVFLNSCRHRGNAVCRAEQGTTRSFLCTYHGWTYDLEGKLIGVPGYKDLYHEQLDRSQWGLVSAGKVASYKGFVFATMDPDAPDLEEYLGPVGRISLDLVAEKDEHMIVIEGVQKNVLGCNWKFAVDNLFDYYHVDVTHASGVMADYKGPAPKPPPGSPPPRAMPREHRVLLGEYGHAIGGPKMTPQMLALMTSKPFTDRDPQWDNSWRDRPEAKAALGEAGLPVNGNPNVFPNLWLTPSQVCLRLPKGPDRTEIWWFTLVPRDLPADKRERWLFDANHMFGPAGLFEQDDGENWDQSTRQTRGVVARRHPLNYQMNMGRGRPKISAEGVTYIDASLTEHAQLWTWRAWAEWMDADSWATLKQSHSPVPTDAL